MILTRPGMQCVAMLRPSSGWTRQTLTSCVKLLDTLLLSFSLVTMLTSKVGNVCVIQSPLVANLLTTSDQRFISRQRYLRYVCRFAMIVVAVFLAMLTSLHMILSVCL